MHQVTLLLVKKRNTTKMARRSLLLSSLTLMLLFISAAAGVQDDKQDLLLQLVREQGGYFNPKQEMRHDDTGLFGVFATQPIDKNEVLASIPWKSVIRSETIDDRFGNCDTVKILAEELAKKEPSVYASTLAANVRRHKHLLPTNWSKQGQDLLMKVTDNGTLPPDDPFMRQFEWKQECDQISRDATLLVLTHGEDIGMVPISDKYNSRAGNYTGAYHSIEGGSGGKPAMEVRAKRFIEKGEQIYTDYVYGQMGTPELLREYGFVESYPQRYIFQSHNVAFDIDQNDGDFEIFWVGKIVDRKYDVIPSSEAIQFLREQFERLKHVYSELLVMGHEDATEVPDNELQVIMRFCRDYKTALTHALHDATTSVPRSMKTFAQE